MSCVAPRQILIEAGSNGTHQYPGAHRYLEEIAALGEQAVLLRRQYLRLLDNLASNLAEAVFRLAPREGEIAHEPLDHPGAGAILLGKRDAARRRKPAILHLIAIDIDGGRVLRVTPLKRETEEGPRPIRVSHPSSV